MQLRRSADPRLNLALKERVRLRHEIAALEGKINVDQRLAASLRMCLARTERELQQRG